MTGRGHHHPEYRTKEEAHRFEDRMYEQLGAIRSEVKALTTRVTLMLGGLTLVAVLLPVIAPFVRALLNIDPPAGQ